MKVSQPFRDPPVVVSEAGREVVEAAASLTKAREFDVGTGVGRAAQGGDNGDVIAGVVDGSEAVDHVAHFLGRVDEAAALDAVSDARVRERALQGRENGARR